MPAGAPPIDAPYRCQAKRKSGKPCMQYALKGSNYCQFHGGRRPAGTRINHLPRIYSRVLNKTLGDLFEEFLNQDPSEQITLFEELALMRATSLDAIRLWSKAHEHEVTEKNHDKIMELRLTAGNIMRDCLKDVQSMCESISNIDAKAKDKISAHQLLYVINQIIRMAHESFGNDPRVHLFEKLIRERIKVHAGEGGTNLTPDQDVLEMDDSIPREAETNDGDAEAGPMG